MKAKDVKIGGVYLVRVGSSSGARMCPVKILWKRPPKGWVGTNLLTGREIRIKTGQRLRQVLSEDDVRQIMMEGDNDTGLQDW